MEYPAIITREGEFTLAEFPDCPGCQTYARKGEDIEAAAREALEGWLEAHLGRDSVPNRTGTVSVPKGAGVRQISVSLTLAFRLALRLARADAGKTQAQFGRILQMTQQQYARLEGSGSNPTLGTIERVASRVGVGVSVTTAPVLTLYKTRPHSRRLRVAETRHAYATKNARARRQDGD